MYKKILAYIDSQKDTYLETWDIQNALHREGAFDYAEFAKGINSLVEEGVIAPVKTSGENHRKDHPLYKKYRKVKTKAFVSEDVKQEILYKYHPKMKVSFYVNSPEEYIQDRPCLLAINEYLNSRKQSWDTVNERSFELFRNEKWLAKEGSSFLKKVGLTLDDLNCGIVYEPFFYYMMPSWKKDSSVNVLIVENKDTYGSFKTLFKEGCNAFGGISFDMLIYGEGEKIISSIESIWEIEVASTKEIKGYYFGDIDPAGIEICLSLMKKDEIPVVPMVVFYEELLKKYHSVRLKRPKNQKTQKYKQDSGEKFSTYLPPSVRGEYFGVIKEYYLPQEGLNKTILRELSERK
jgi:hypothetical protein